MSDLIGAGKTLCSAKSCQNGLVRDRKSTRLNSSHVSISYAVFCLKKKKKRILKPLDGRDFRHYRRHHHVPSKQLFLSSSYHHCLRHFACATRNIDVTCRHGSDYSL